MFWLVPLSSVLALAFAARFYVQMRRLPEGTLRMTQIAAAVREGAMSYLRQQYKVVGAVFAVLAVVFGVMSWGFGVQNGWVPVAFLTGGLFSALAGFLGMKTATHASARVAHAARASLGGALGVAFRSGAVMGLVVTGLGLLDIAFWYALLDTVLPDAGGGAKLCLITTTMLTFGMGASTQALFARVGGGIYTKAADVGADLVGKVEAGIPEDDPRNPATIADNVGDNVGDVAGMGADLYESFCGSILAAAALGAAAFAHSGAAAQLGAVLAPMMIAAVGTLISIVAIYAVRVRGEGDAALLAALDRGTRLATLLLVPASFAVLWALGAAWWVRGGVTVCIGLAVGMVIGTATERATSHAFQPTRRVAESGQTGAATVVIAGLGLGMTSTAVPVLAVGAGIVGAYWVMAAGTADATLGLYGVATAAVGMLSTLGITLATDAYGPIADNAGGNAEMSALPDEVRQRTDALDALGNTTAATGKGFAIGSAALTALALLASYMEEVRMGLLRAGHTVLNLTGGESVDTAKATLWQLAEYFNLTLINPRVLTGLFCGAMLALVFCGLTMNAVGRAAGQMVAEVRRQFREISGLLDGTAAPDYARCVRISTVGAQREMALPALLAIAAPVAAGLLLGVDGVVGLLCGGLAAGFSLAVFMANAGGAWDNAKKYVEQGALGGKGSPVHKATVVGDTVGDPFKDTAGPSLNILIKLMSMVAIVMAGLTALMN